MWAHGPTLEEIVSGFVEEYRKLDEHAGRLEEVAEDYKSRAEDDRWEQCRIVFEAVDSGEFTRRAFAESVGKSEQTIGRQYRMWNDWGTIHADSRPTYWEAQAEIRNHATGQERTKEIAREGIRRLSTQDKADVVRELIEDEDVASAAVADRSVRGAFARAQTHIEKEVAERQRERMPGIKRLGREQAIAEGFSTFTSYRKRLRETIAALRGENLDEDERASLVEQARKTIGATELFIDSIKGESWDDALARMSSGGDVK